MLLYARKKLFRDDRLLQLMLILSLLRGTPEEMVNLGDTSLDEGHLRDLALGSSLGHAQLPQNIDLNFHPKSMDRVLANYQRSILDDLNSLGRFSSNHDIQYGDVTAYLLNSQQNARSSSSSTGPNTPSQSSTPSPSPQISPSTGGGAALNSQILMTTAPAETPPAALLTPLSPRSPAQPSSGAGPVQDLSLEDEALIDALFKQDVDVGVPREIYLEDEEESAGSMYKDKLALCGEKLAVPDKDYEPEPSSTKTAQDNEEEKWTVFNITVDSETGEHLIATEVSSSFCCEESTPEESTPPAPESFTPSAPEEDIQQIPTTEEEEVDQEQATPFTSSATTSSLANPLPIEDTPLPLLLSPPYSPPVTQYDLDLDVEFDLEEALQLAGLHCDDPQSPDCQDISEDRQTETALGARSRTRSLCEDDDQSDSGFSSTSTLDALGDTLDEMIQATQLLSHHPRPAVQGRLGGLVRSGSMEQRWQDLASLLSLPSTDPSSTHHGHHTHHQSPPVGGGAHATSPPHTPVHAQPIHHPHALYPAHDSTVVSAGSPGVPRGVLLHNATLPPPMPDPMGHNLTYSNSMGASSHLVSSSMNLTNSADLAGTDHNQYKMETNSSMPSDMMYYQNSTTEMNQTTDGLLSTLLNDENLQMMELAIDYNGRNNVSDYSTGSYRYSSDELHRHPQVAQKKQYMFGRRGFHDHPHGAAPVQDSLGSPAGGVPVGANYTGHYPPTPTPTPGGATAMEGATALDPCDMKYSTMDYRSPDVPGPVDHIQHNHTYHMSPEGPSGLTRPAHRDKHRGKKSDAERSLTRDEKRARSLNLPISCDDIINLPMDEFNERISKYDLSENQLSLIRDIRRRGKNKVAAQNCRKRKLDQIMNLAVEVKEIHTRKSDLLNEYKYWSNERARIKQKFTLLYNHIFQSLRDPEGNAYSLCDYSLQQSADGSVVLVPKSSMSLPGLPSTSNSKHRNGKDDSNR